MKKSIGILGGMGPLATTDIFTKIVNLTKAERDTEHIRIFIDNNPYIPDRTAAILSGGKDPVPQMADSVKKLEQCGADCIIMTCNTAHFFLPKLQKLTDVPFISMLTATAEASLEKFPNKKAAILATNGTISSKLYDNILSEFGVDFITPNDKEQEAVMRVIYDGVKANAPAESYRDDMMTVINGLSERGADYFILGCTELPIATELLGIQNPVIDSTTELAKAAIKFCGYELK